jgi:DnaJ-class molecular chaperone
MPEDLDSINRKLSDVFDDLQRLLSRRMHETARGAVDPVLRDMLKDAGMDRGMDSGQSATAPYGVLGLDRDAPNEEVKKRYIELVHALHPDKSGTPATGRFFQMVQAAYELIKQERGWP